MPPHCASVAQLATLRRSAAVRATSRDAAVVACVLLLQQILDEVGAGGKKDASAESRRNRLGPFDVELAPAQLEPDVAVTASLTVSNSTNALAASVPSPRIGNEIDLVPSLQHPHPEDPRHNEKAASTKDGFFACAAFGWARVVPCPAQLAHALVFELTLVDLCPQPGATSSSNSPAVAALMPMISLREILRSRDRPCPPFRLASVRFSVGSGAAARRLTRCTLRPRCRSSEPRAQAS